MKKCNYAVRRITLIAILPALLVPLTARAQVSRESLIQQAEAEFDARRRIELLGAAVDPSAAPIDSTWGYAVQLLAQTFVEEGNDRLAETLLRWAVRLRPDLEIDTQQFLPQVAAIHERAREAVTRSASSADSTTETRWPNWPAPFRSNRAARIRIAPGTLPALLQIQLVGEGRLDPGGSRGVNAGSYEVIASAEGHETARVTREALPGVTTEIEFGLVPFLEDAIITRSTRLIARITARGMAGERCGTGFFADDGLLLTTYGVIKAAERLEVTTTGGRLSFDDVRVAAYDKDRDLAVLEIDMRQTEALPLAGDVTDGEFAWAIHYSDCTSPSTSGTRVREWQNRTLGPLRLATTLPGDAMGSPLIDRNGSVLGIVAAEDRAVPAPHAAAVLDEARRNLASGHTLTVREVANREEGLALASPGIGSHFPWKWVAIGAAGIGATVAIALAVGGNDETPPPGTGGIVITLPN